MKKPIPSPDEIKRVINESTRRAKARKSRPSITLLDRIKGAFKGFLHPERITK